MLDAVARLRRLRPLSLRAQRNDAAARLQRLHTHDYVVTHRLHHRGYNVCTRTLTRLRTHPTLHLTLVAHPWLRDARNRLHASCGACRGSLTQTRRKNRKRVRLRQCAGAPTSEALLTRAAMCPGGLDTVTRGRLETVSRRNNEREIHTDRALWCGRCARKMCSIPSTTDANDKAQGQRDFRVRSGRPGAGRKAFQVWRCRVYRELYPKGDASDTRTSPAYGRKTIPVYGRQLHSCLCRLGRPEIASASAYWRKTVQVPRARL
jgi:hypothetical protein